MENGGEMTRSGLPPVVILCGGKGTRLKEETEFKPKPLVEVGGVPILIHIMKIYASQGFKEFILCLGYKGEMIKRYFLDQKYMLNDFTMDTDSDAIEFHDNLALRDCKIIFAETGKETLTAGRIKKIQKYVNTDHFMLTYGDGVGDVNVRELLEMHKRENKICTFTGVNPFSKYGLVKVGDNYEVLDFTEKPKMNDIVNAGFMVMHRSFFDRITEDCMFESKILPQLSRERQVQVYHHKGFWHCMDTYKDYQDLNELWEASKPWKVWRE